VSNDLAHWQRVYRERRLQEVSWYEPVPEASLELIEEAALARDAAILDAGGGASNLAGHLLRVGYTDITVADISEAALRHSREELGPDAERITWLQTDLRTHGLGRRFDLWHDRAVLHFMVDPADRAAYLDTLRDAVRPSGHLIVATFGPEGPAQCSGLPVDRYSAAELAALLADDFELLSSRLLLHRTPSGTTQQFLYGHLVRYREPSSPVR
jgi:SAM-dependent methyltransferase